VTGPQGPCQAQAAVLPAGGDRPDEDGPPSSPEVIQVEPRSSVGLLVPLRLPLDEPNLEKVLPADRGSAGELRVSVEYGATSWPWGRPARRRSRLSIPQSELAAAVERWRASTPAPADQRPPPAEEQGWVPPKSVRGAVTQAAGDAGE
jgi:hypothetical protein